MDHQDITFNVTGQSLYLDVPEARPSSITSVTVLPWDAGDDDTAETATTGSAAVETNPSTTFDANSGVSSSDTKLINLAATTGIEVGRSYLATNANLETEWVEIAAVTSAASAQARIPLHNDYVSGDSFESTRISISVLDAWVQNTNSISDGVNPNPGYRVRWVYVATPPGGSSQTYVRYSYLDVVRAKGQHNVLPSDMEVFVGNWSRLLPTGHREDQGRGIIDEAYEMVKLDLLAHGVPDQQVRNQFAIDELVKRKATLMMQMARVYGGAGDTIAFELARDEYDGMLNKLFRSDTKVSLAVDESGAGTSTSTGGIWSR